VARVPAPRSLFFRLAAPLGAVLILSFGVAAVFSISAGRRTLQSRVSEELLTSAHSVRDEVERFLRERHGDMNVVAGLETMDDVLIRDRDLRIQNLLLRLHRVYSPSYRELLVLAADSTVMSATRLARIGSRLDLDALDLVQGAGGVDWQSRRVTVPSGTTEPVIAIAVPIRSRLNPEPVGWLVGMVDWNIVEDIVAGARVGGEPSGGGFAVLADGTGKPIAGRRHLIERLPLAAGELRKMGGAAVCRSRASARAPSIWSPSNPASAGAGAPPRAGASSPSATREPRSPRCVCSPGACCWRSCSDSAWRRAAPSSSRAASRYRSTG
jgi:hypothetical protein